MPKIPLPEMTEYERQFDETIRQYNQAFEDRDLGRFVSFFRDDAAKIDPTGDTAWNKEQITELFRGLFKMDFTAKFPAVKKVVDRHTALLVTDMTLTFRDFEQRFLTSLTFTYQDREWKVLSAASTSLPAS